MALINKSLCKAEALRIAEKTRGGKFKRVSQQFLDRLERRVQEVIRQEVASHPSIGVTLK
jgi:hypothetical protein